MTIEAVIDGVIGREGRYSNNAADAGGETMWGITIGTARRNGYTGPMRSMPRETAVAIYRAEFVVGPGYAAIMPISAAIAEKLVDIGVNCGPAVGSMALQRILSALNNGGKDYPDLQLDGNAGERSRSALTIFLKKRGKEGEARLLNALRFVQGERYLDITEKRPANEEFFYGWLGRAAA